MKIKFVEQLSETLKSKMQADVINYESNCGVYVNFKPFALTLSVDQEVVAILNAYTAYSEVYIDDLWVHQRHRRQGYGKLLISELESNFKSKGFNNINLVTSAFQAPEFYIKCGFELEFTRENLHNPKFTKFFFVKFFDNEEQMQGIISKQCAD
jgi:ribosomal protein S18 acetylase RimI-like enzyme